MKPGIAKIILGPLLLLQGRIVRRRVLRLPEPPGPRSGVRGKGERLRLLILGDSATAGVGAPDQDAALSGQVVGRLAAIRQIDWVLSAKTGATTRSTLRYLRCLHGQRFDLAVTALGVNDVTTDLSAEDWLREQARLRAELRSNCGVERFLVCGLPPVSHFPALPQPLRWYLGRRADLFSARLAVDLAAEPDCRFLPLDFSRDVTLMAADGFHPGPGAYAAWGARVAAAVAAMLREG